MSAEKRTDPSDWTSSRTLASASRRPRAFRALRFAVPVLIGAMAILAVAKVFAEHGRAQSWVGHVPRARETLVIPSRAASLTPITPAAARARGYAPTNSTTASPPRIAATSDLSRAITRAAPGLPAGTIRIIAPDRSVSWAIGRDGAIFHTNREGAVSSQSSGVTENLTAGAAASAQVCWIVGRAGTILRTTDGGAHWAQLSAPVADDKRAITSISARSANDASLIDATGNRYYTTDGGATWSRRG
jgi:hypothetical protein